MRTVWYAVPVVDCTDVDHLPIRLPDTADSRMRLTHGYGWLTAPGDGWLTAHGYGSPLRSGWLPARIWLAHRPISSRVATHASLALRGLAAYDGAMERGQIIAGRYRLSRILGEGGLGVVWEGWQGGIERRVAIKFLKPSGPRTCSDS